MKMKIRQTNTSFDAVIFGLQYGLVSFLSTICLFASFMRQHSWDLGQKGNLGFLAFRKSYLITGCHFLAYLTSSLCLPNGQLIRDQYIKLLTSACLLIFLWNNFTRRKSELFYDHTFDFWTFFLVPNALISRLLVQRLLEPKGRLEFVATIILVWIVGSSFLVLWLCFLKKHKNPKTKVIDERIDALARLLFVLLIFYFVGRGPRPPAVGPSLAPNAGELAIIRHADLEEEDWGEEDWDREKGLIII